MELKDLLQRLDAPKDLIEKLTGEEADIKDFNEFIDSSWISRGVAQDDEDIQKKVTGKLTGTLDNKLRKIFSFTPAETEGKQLSEVIEMGGVKQQEKVDGLQKLIDDSDSSDVISKFQKDAENLTNKIKEHEQTEMDLRKENEEQKTSHGEELKGIQVNTLLTQEISNVSFKDDLSPLERKGFHSEIQDNFKFILDDNSQIQVTDRQGEKIQNENKTDYLSVKDVLESTANENKLLKNNNLNNGEQKPVVANNLTPATDPGKKFNQLGTGAVKNVADTQNATTISKV